MTSEERQQIETRLDARLDELKRTRAAMRRAGDGPGDTELGHVDNHPGDQGSELHDEELDETTAIFLQDEEDRINDARRALANGTYGVCRDCGRQIPPERLRVMPEAVRCVECQRQYEGLHRQRTPL